MFKSVLAKLIEGDVLTEREAYEAMNEIMVGNVTPSQISSLLSILRFRGESASEMTGFSKSMREHMTAIDYEDENVIDTCGTGGDGTSTFNISTAVAIVVSALGVKVAKHGNRAVSSKSGSADVLEYLGVPIQASAEEAKQALAKQNMSFLFAPIYHSAMKHAAVSRQEIGFRTIFNLLGPISNPARCKKQVLGVYSTEYAEKMAQTLNNLGSSHVLLVTGRDGLDECSICTETDIVELKDQKITRFTITPEEMGLQRGHVDDLTVSSVSESAQLIESILAGNGNESATNIVLLNAGAALYVAGKADTMKKGVSIAKDAIHSKVVSDHFQRLREKKVSGNAR